MSRLRRATGSGGDLPVRRAAMIAVIGTGQVAQLEEALGALELELTVDD